MSIFPDDLITSDEFARELGLRNQTLMAWRTMGRGPHFHKVGRRVMYSRKDIAAWLETQRRQPKASPHAMKAA